MKRRIKSLSISAAIKKIPQNSFSGTASRWERNTKIIMRTKQATIYMREDKEAPP
jgi:hypothetical protein